MRHLEGLRVGIFRGMPSFDVVSQIDIQEVRNAVDQAAREVRTRYDFKDTGSEVALDDAGISLSSSSEDRLNALRQVLEEKLVKRKVSLKAISYGDVEEASGATVRQFATLQSGISSDKTKELNKFIKTLGIKGVQSQTQGDQLRVTSKKRDHLQTVISELKEADFELALQYENFRD
ncbi:MAG: YajQ family cyclic di-GMP-binding protein [Actinomycetota bacterium]|nr:YajQ family cyclic di-GMP-binding protein [Actinomycetota bacterium]